MAEDHAELNAAITDMIHMLDANDMGGFLLKYSSPTMLQQMAQSFATSRLKAAQFRAANNLAQLPDQTFEESLQAMQGQPLAPFMKNILAELKALQGVAPTLNEAGDVAEFEIDVPVSATLPDHPDKLHLNKEDGRWYADALLDTLVKN